MSSAISFPDIQARSIYTGKFKDWSPSIRSAGKLTATGDSTGLCLQPTDKRPQSPSAVRKFRGFYFPEAGQARVFYGQANDPHRLWAAAMTHGVNTQPSITSGEVVNPHPKTRFQHKLIGQREKIYHSHKTGPLGKAQHGILPQHLDPYQFTFGVPTELDIGAGGLINPYKNYATVEEEGKVGHDMYVMTHHDFDVGEPISRCYTQPSYSPMKRFGIPTEHFNDGRNVRKTLKWLQETQAEKTTQVVSQRVDNFRERTQPKLGEVHDPIKDTLNVPMGHTFGILFKPDEYGAGDLLHMRGPGTYLRGKDRQRGVLGAVRQHLKKANYHNFQDLLAAFRHFDKDQQGRIDMKGLREVCIQYHLPVEPELLEQLLDYCDVNKDGYIDYLEFANFLNWKDKMPSGFGKKDANDSCEELEIKSPQSSESTPRRLKKQIDEAIGAHRTSASMINAVVGGVSTRGYRTYGTPTIRTDRPAPRTRRIDDRTNYGDESDTYGLLNPSIYSQRGVFEKDFLLPREKEELRSIFTNIGVQMTLDMFDQLYNRAVSQHPRGHVCIESIRCVLDDVIAEEVTKDTN